ncbi:MAG: GntR family transcriptional regulator [Actinobacteria bacterium]|jgi:GntR family transcriptional regulator|nr:GntR family transcriptional regulator [Actinomycetota bacterium]
MTTQILDPRAGLPLYHQLADLLRRRIISGELAVGATLPTEAQLMAAYSVSRVTARQAVGLLVDEGLVERGSGRGTRVLPAATARAGQHFSGSLSELINETQRTRVKDVRIERGVPAPADVREALRLAPDGSDLVRVSRTRYLDDEVFAYTVDHLPAGIGRLVTKRALAQDSLMALLARSGVDLASARQAIRADVANAENAPLLDLRPGDPVLAVTRVVYDSRRQPVYHIRTYYRGDRYTYTVELRLNNADPGAIHGDLA